MIKDPRAPPTDEPPDLSQYENPWCIYATISQATHAIEDIINQAMGMPITGTHGNDGSPAPEAQKTTTWAIPLEIAEGGYGFPAPPQEFLPSDPGEVREYDPAWFPVDENGIPIPP